ncbi:MAG: hypothetical protein ACK5Q5_20750 [Planctomycetaceae bacterium]
MSDRKMLLIGRLLLAAALLGTVGSSLRAYPHQLAYFNESAGGPHNGWRHLLGSSLDWGQDITQAVRLSGRAGSPSNLTVLSISPVPPRAYGFPELAHFAAIPIAGGRPEFGNQVCIVSCNLLAGLEADVDQGNGKSFHAEPAMFRQFGEVAIFPDWDLVSMIPCERQNDPLASFIQFDERAR